MRPISTLTSKGQVTIPKEIRDELGLKPHDKIRFFVENGSVRLRRDFRLEELVGILPPLGMPIDEAIELAKEERALQFMAKLNAKDAERDCDTREQSICIATRRIGMGRAMTLTSKGQVTIPKEVRDKLGLRPHDKIAFSLEDGYVTLSKA
jgi:antitoxin PrlF